MVVRLLALLSSLYLAVASVGPTNSVLFTQATLPNFCANGEVAVSGSNVMNICQSNSWTPVASGGSGSVTEVFPGTGIITVPGAGITTVGTVSLGTTGVIANTYGNANNVSQITINAQGQITSANNFGISNLNANVLQSGTINTAQEGAYIGTVTGVFGDGTNTLTNPLAGITGVGTVGLGTVAIVKGGTGQVSTPTDGQLLIGDSSTNGFTLNTITAGSNVTVTNGHHTITIAATGGGGGGSAGTVAVSTFTSSGTFAYATPAGCLALEIDQVGAGGGGGGTGTSGAGSAGNPGGDSYFGPSAASHYVYTSGGHGGPVAGNNSFAQCALCTGGTISVSAPAQAVIQTPGGIGAVSMNNAGNACYMVAYGAATILAPSPIGQKSEDIAGTAAPANSGAGGSGTCDSTGGNDGCGGCAGAYVHYWIDNPSGTYAGQVGGKGTGGAGGAGTAYAGGNGADGYIAITCHF